MPRRSDTSPRRHPRTTSTDTTRRRRATRLIAPALLAGWLVAAAAPRADASGLPVARIHSLDEIGNVPTGAMLGFDPIGRVAVIHDDTYAVLNDQSWVHQMDATGADITSYVLQEADGAAWYGSVGSWGRVERTAEGRLRPVPIRPEVVPEWVRSTNFIQILPVESGVFFAGWTGAAYWDRASGRHQFFEVQELLKMFRLGPAVYFSSGTRGLLRVDLAADTLHAVLPRHVDDRAIDRATTLADGRVLGATRREGIYVIEGESARPWAPRHNGMFRAGIGELCALAEGGVAVAVNGTGLYIFSADGAIQASYTSTEYFAIQAMAAREPGILWLTNELGVQQVFYGSSASVIDQRLGLPVRWPQVVRWRDRIVVSSQGRLFDEVPEGPGRTSRFEPVANQRGDGSWAIGALGDHLLSGNKIGAFALGETGRFEPVVRGIDVARLVTVEPDLCYLIGMYEISAMRLENGRWTECAERIPGFGYPAIVHRAGRSAWVELGANRAVRVTFADGRLEARLFDTFPWTEPRWINIGVLDDVVVLSGPEGGRVYFDEALGDFRPAPELEAVLDHSPFWLARVVRDSSGTIWGSHNHGVLKLVREGDIWRADLDTLGTIRDRYPVIQVLEGDDVWIASGSALYRAGSPVASHPVAGIQPVLDAAIDARTGRLIADAGPSLGRLPYASNSLSLRFFAGTYRVRSPTYTFRMHGPSATWSINDADSFLTLPDLKEGRYRLEVALTDSRRPVGAPVSIDFEIAPPWFRTMYAYLGYALCGLAMVHVLVSWSVHRTRSHNAQLARMVQERTNELQRTMQRLGEETRHAAILAERDRLAGEIHDSLQQGLSGLMLHLDATLKLPGIGDDLRARLTVARNMVSFTRHEVQHAIWDMESPLLEDGDLADSLRKLAAWINSSGARVEIDVSGAARPVSSATTHHLLRIAQEAMTNAIRHAAAGVVSLRLAYEDEEVVLTVSDDGRGFEPDRALSQGVGHFGLRGMRGRAGKIHGRLEVYSAPGRGTAVTIRVPLPARSSPLLHDTHV